MFLIKNKKYYYENCFKKAHGFSRGSMSSEQYKVMRQYLNILNCRIDLLLTKEDKIELENGTK